MSTEQALTPSSYIEHHLGFNAKQVGDSSFWTLHVDTLVVSALLGVVVFGLIWLVVRGATAGVPNKRQAFVELLVEFVDDQVKARRCCRFRPAAHRFLRRHVDPAPAPQNWVRRRKGRGHSRPDWESGPRQIDR